MGGLNEILPGDTEPIPEIDSANTSSGESDAEKIVTNRDDAHIEAATVPLSSMNSLPKERWNQPKVNIGRTLICFLALFNVGLNDASYGALLPFVQAYYRLDYLVASLMFAFPFIGYIITSFFNHRIHVLFGQRGIAILGPLIRLVVYLIISFAPPYPAVLACFAVNGIGIGLIDSGWNAWVGSLENPNQLLGLMHGLYGAGATISPAIATEMITRYHCDWNQFMYIPLGLVTVELVLGSWIFWDQDAAVFNAKEQAQIRLDTKQATTNAGLKGAIKFKVTWIVAVFLFVYVGTEVAIGGWIPTFMNTVRHASHFSAGMSATGFWLGLTLGRITLGFITPLVGEKLGVCIYLAVSLALQLIFWLVPTYIVSTVAVALLGFFQGPLYPAAIVMATKLLPKNLHISSIGFAASFGGGGAAILPFVTGAIVDATNVRQLQPIVLAFLVLLIVIWLLLPSTSKNNSNFWRSHPRKLLRKLKISRTN